MPEPLRILCRSIQPIVLPDQSWEAGSSLLPIAAFADEAPAGLLLYYVARFKDRPLENLLCLARSTDGRNWSKPDCGSGTNVVMRSSGNLNDWGQFTPTTILRAAHEPNPTHRWKMLYWDRPETAMSSGLCLATSADGLRWAPLHARPIITGANDAASMIAAIPGVKTPLGIGSHLIHQQTLKHNPRLPTARDNLKGLHRGISVWQCEAFTGRWVGPVGILEPDADDAPDLQFYWLAPFQAAGGVYGGFLHCHHTIDQTMDVQLVSSRDGWSWTRENARAPLLPLGSRGSFDSGMIAAISSPVRWQDRVLLFYQGRPTVHDGKPRYPDDPPPPAGIGLAEYSPELLSLRPQ